MKYPSGAPASVSVSNVALGALSTHAYPSTYTHDCAAAVFANGDPQAALDAISVATWRAKTDAQVITTAATALQPATGAGGVCGTLDAGAGNAYGAATFDVTPTWNDGSGKPIQ